MKMETPKMDVVRFKEADVLAASPSPAPVYHDYVTLSNLGNSNFDDNKAHAMNTDFSFSNIYAGEVSNLLHLDSIFNIGSDEQTLHQLAENTYKSDSSEYSNFNGLYEFDKTEGKYFKKQ